MMRLLVVILLFALTRGASWTIMNITSGTNFVTMDISPNSANTSLTDLTFYFTPANYSVPLTANGYLQVGCVDVVSPNFSPSVAQTGLIGFLLEIKCADPCDSLTAVNSGAAPAMYYGNVFGWTGSVLSTSGALTAGPTLTTGITSLTAFQRASAIKPAQWRMYGLPTEKDNFYYKCFGKINGSDIDQTVAINKLHYNLSDGILDVTIERNPSTTSLTSSRAEFRIPFVFTTTSMIIFFFT